MANVAEKKPAVKAERKKPVRTAPVQKDYPNKLAWLRAMTEHEEQQAKVETVAKLARLDKRIASAKVARDEAAAKVTALEAERATLTGEEQATDVATSETGEAVQPQG